MAHAQKPDFVFPRNGRVHLNRWRRQFSRLLAAEVCASASVMLDRTRSEVAWEYWLPTPFASFPFTSPPPHPPASPCPPGSERAVLKILVIVQSRPRQAYRPGMRMDLLHSWGPKWMKWPVSMSKGRRWYSFLLPLLVVHRNFVSCGSEIRDRKAAARRGLTSFDCLSNDPVR